MALVSMCISLMQEQLVQKTRWLLTEVGIIEEDIDPMQKYKVSITIFTHFLCQTQRKSCQSHSKYGIIYSVLDSTFDKGTVMCLDHFQNHLHQPVQHILSKIQDLSLQFCTSIIFISMHKSIS